MKSWRKEGRSKKIKTQFKAPPCEARDFYLGLGGEKEVMINWFKKEPFKEYKDLLRQAFPKALAKDLEVVLDILPFDVNEIQSRDGKIQKVDSLINAETLSVQLENETLTIPYRLYFNEPDSKEESKLTETQKAILNCIFLSHYNGYLRQRRLEQLINRNEYWLTPFTFRLLGGYVFEIVEVLDKHIIAKNIENYKRFILENPKYWQTTEGRVISYWNVYYRVKYF